MTMPAKRNKRQSTSAAAVAKLDDAELACMGINHLINNDWDASEKLFKEYKDLYPLMQYGHSLVSFLRAIMTFEEQLLDQAQKDLELTEKMCTEQTKMFTSFKKAFGISSSSSSNSNNSSSSNQLKQNATLAAAESSSANSNSNYLEEKYTKAIILADCKLYLALLTFIRQEISGFLTNGILQIRRSWKLYAKVQRQLFDLYKKIEPNAEQIYGSNPDTAVVELVIEDIEAENGNSGNAGENVNGNGGSGGLKPSATTFQLNELTISDEELQGITPDAVKRLLGGVSFGYGVFQICLSFMPPNALKLVKIFGFEGDRSVALKAITFAANSKDLRAPFADMMLLWYSTVATPLFGLTEQDLTISNSETESIIDKNLKKFPKSSLFYYYKGKYMRSLKNIEQALKCYDEAYQNSKHVREIQHISIFEIGWIHMMSLDYQKALDQFDILSKESRWSKSFNCYICSVLSGSMGNYAAANGYIKEALKIVAAQTRKSNPMEQFAIKRLEYFKKETIKESSKSLCELLVIEFLFLWICLPYCQQETLKIMLAKLDKITDKKFIALKCLFEGAIHMETNNKEFGEQCFNEALARGEEKMPFGKYVLPYANYRLGVYGMELKEYDNSKLLLNKARDGYKDYELENRIQTQVKSAQRRLKHLTETDKDQLGQKAKREQEEEERKKKQIEIDNFYVN